MTYAEFLGIAEIVLYVAVLLFILADWAADRLDWLADRLTRGDK